MAVIVLNRLTCTDADPYVATEVANAATGSTVVMPSGTTAWEKQVIIDSKQITLVGAGVGTTVITDNTPTSGPTASVGNSCLGVLNQSELAPSDVSAFTLVQGTESVVIGTNALVYKCKKTHIAHDAPNLTGNRPVVGSSAWATFWTNTTVDGPGVPWVEGTRYTSGKHGSGGMIMATSNQRVKAAWRVHDITFNYNSATTGIYAVSYGVIDNIIFNVSTTGTHAIEGFGESNADGGGYGPWSDAPGMGDQRALFIEKCHFNWPASAAGGEVCIDGFGGARFVIRDNDFLNAIPGWHGCDSGFFRSTIGAEMYNNRFTNNGTVNMRGATCRGGRGVFYDNTYYGSRKTWDGYTLQYFRADPSSTVLSNWGICDGTQWELNGTTTNNDRSTNRGTCVGATTNGAAYAIGNTVITLAAAGTGFIVARTALGPTAISGDNVRIGNTSYTVTNTSAGTGLPGLNVAGGGTITISPGLAASIPAVPTPILCGGYRFDDATNSVLGAEGGSNNTYFDGPVIGTVPYTTPSPGGTVTVCYPGRDQPGRDARQTLSPFFAWNNTSGPGEGITQLPALGPFVAAQNTAGQERLDAMVVSNRDYYNLPAGQTPNDVGFPYSPFQYPHPLRVAADTTAPATPTGLTVS